MSIILQIGLVVKGVAGDFHGVRFDRFDPVQGIAAILLASSGLTALT